MATARSGAIRYSRFENREMLVRLYGDDAAVVTGITAVAGATKDGHAFDIDVRFTDTFVREQGRWRIAASQASSPLKKE
jgi:ketosteroid isomerase-like protein